MSIESNVESEPLKDRSEEIENGSEKVVKPDLKIISRGFLRFLKEINEEDTPKRSKEISKKQKTNKKKKEEKEIEEKQNIINTNIQLTENQNLRNSENIYTDLSSLKEWSLPQIIQHLQYCFANNLLSTEQIQQIDRWIAEQISLKKIKVDSPEFGPVNNDQYPTNCLHIKISYFIWDSNNQEVLDPTEFSRAYKMSSKSKEYSSDRLSQE